MNELRPKMGILTRGVLPTAPVSPSTVLVVKARRSIVARLKDIMVEEQDKLCGHVCGKGSSVSW